MVGIWSYYGAWSQRDRPAAIQDDPGLGFLLFLLTLWLPEYAPMHTCIHHVSSLIHQDLSLLWITEIINSRLSYIIKTFQIAKIVEKLQFTNFLYSSLQSLIL